MDTLHSMRVFVRVIDTGSFTAAAQAMDLSTAQVSRLVSELEQQLQARLLHRTTRRLALTEVGERYLQRCRQILGEVDEAAAEARGAHLKPHGRLRVHTMTGLGLQHLTPLVARYSELYPEVVVELTLSQRTPDLLEDGHDVIITFARELPDSQMVAQVLGPMFSVLCAAPAYLKKHGVPVSPVDLQHHRYLRLLDPLYEDSWVFNGEQGEFNVLPAESFQVNVAESLAKAAQAGMGVCLLPSFVACPPVREGKLLRLLPEYRLRERNIYAIYPSRRFLDAKIKTWVEFLKAELPPLLTQDEALLEDPKRWAINAKLLRKEK
ncbi:LysR family transcriptional regulator [Pseudomonas sp. BN414]|uniref:LysR family transcriptional regulator n=1 Tax=Pseudomonas TaxID=286 RepID=UPI0015BEB748|nr:MULTISPECIES: LysR family transcriptional regulator [Pseudomonas]MDH4565281.1 LysR family transcriptional regulator [Pseudomonas sp. BN414]NWL77375.1 LysR family transcriptional regulator [Pseudomonas taiwanensis]